MASLFAKKLIADAPVERGLKRELGAGDLIMLAIGAVVGAGIFSSIGTSAAGEIVDGHVVRLGAGPALVVSFVLLGVVCGLAALCYAELAAMIPEAGSAYAYAYATLGELIAWIIGWDLLLEYAVGNVAVAVAWSGYLTPLLGSIGIDLPVWLTRGYFNVTHMGDAVARQALIDGAPQLFGMPLLVDLPAFLIVAFVTWLLLRGVKESARANHVMVGIKLVVLAVFIVVGALHINPENYKPFAPNGFAGIHQGAAIVFFAYIGFDAISTAAEETKNPQRNLPIGILGGLAICTVLYVLVGAVSTGLVPYQELGARDPLAHALKSVGLPSAAAIVAIGALVSTTAVLLVFQYGQPRILYAMARDGLLPHAIARIDQKSGTPRGATIVTGLLVAIGSAVADDDATYDLTNIGTLFAFFLVCIGVLALRVSDPARKRPFRVPMVWVIAPLGALACLWTMLGLPMATWIRFAVWLAIGLVLYFAFGYRHSVLRKSSG